MPHTASSLLSGLTTRLPRRPQRLIAQDRFVCQFNIEGRVTTVPAQLLGSDIYCEEMEFNYLGKQPNITAAFAVIWGSGKPLDNPEDVRGERLKETGGGD